MPTESVSESEKIRSTCLMTAMQLYRRLNWRLQENYLVRGRTGPPCGAASHQKEEDQTVAAHQPMCPEIVELAEDGEEPDEPTTINIQTTLDIGTGVIRVE
jgi:hypothetical protein